MIRFTLCLFFLLFTACLKVTDIPTDSPAAPSDLQVIGDLEANHYFVQIPFPTGAEKVERSEQSQDSSTEAPAAVDLPLKISNGILTDDHILAGHSYTYQVGYQKSGSFEPLQTYKVKIPLDYLINQEVVLSKDEMWSQFGRIFLTRTGLITTNGHQLFIQADQLLSDSGKIRTFASSENNQLGTAGLSGGNIQLILRTAQGNLKLEMRGQNGAQGVTGATLPADTLPPPSSGNQGGTETGSVGPTYYSGLRSQPGGRGGNGGAGGNSGRYQISILEPHTLHIERTVLEGRAGSAGIGGAPQPLGGYCTILGDKGPDGSPGIDGVKESSCVKDLTGLACQ